MTAPVAATETTPLHPPSRKKKKKDDPVDTKIKGIAVVSQGIAGSCCGKMCESPPPGTCMMAFYCVCGVLWELATIACCCVAYHCMEDGEGDRERENDG